MTEKHSLKITLGGSSGITLFISIYTQLLGCIFHHVRIDVHTFYCNG